MQTTNGQYRDKFSRRYVHVNPDIYQGPWTWRLSNLAASADPNDDLLSIFTVLPIDDEQTAPGVYRLFFNIEDLPDIRNITRTVTRGRTATSYLTPKTVKGLTAVQGIAPIATGVVGDDVAIYFDIASLNPLVTKKGRKFNVKGFNYNSKSIDNLSADKPLYVSSAGATTAIVSFDISQLDHA